MAKYNYESNRSPVDYTVSITLSGGRVLERGGASEELSAEEVDFLRRNYVLTKVQDDRPVVTGR